MKRTDFSEFHCSLARALDVVGDGWTLLIIRDLAVGLDQFDQFAENLGLSRNLLTARLKMLEERGVLIREPYSDHPPRWRYRLTEKGRALAPIIAALTAWGDEWEPQADGPPIVFRHKDCGADIVPQICCPACREPLSAGNLTFRRGPGARVARGTRLISAPD